MAGLPSDAILQMARERALQMARADWQYGTIGEDAAITKARIYEAYLTGKPVIASDSEEHEQSNVRMWRP